MRSFVRKLNENEYEVTYFAMETGEFMVGIRWNGEPIWGSPFRACVVDPAKVRLLNELQRSGEVDLLLRFVSICALWFTRA